MLQKVYNSQARLLVLLLGKGGTKAARSIKLVPGENAVPAELLAAAREHPQFKAWGKMDWVTVGSARAAAAPAAPAPASLAEMKAHDAVRFVRAHESLEDLERWRQNEDRQTVVTAVLERIAAIGGDGSAGDHGSDE